MRHSHDTVTEEPVHAAHRAGARRAGPDRQAAVAVAADRRRRALRAEPRQARLRRRSVAVARGRAPAALYEEWSAYKARRCNALKRLLVKPPLPKGVYLWGAVGRGKSFLMDAFYLCVPLVRKRRVHFHHFMREIHRELNELKGTEDPIAAVAERTARRYRLICFDEFHVSDIADAMILGRYLEQVMERGVRVRDDQQLPPRPALPERPAARALPAGDRAAQGAARRGRGGQRHRLPAPEDGEAAGSTTPAPAPTPSWSASSPS